MAVDGTVENLAKPGSIAYIPPSSPPTSLWQGPSHHGVDLDADHYKEKRKAPNVLHLAVMSYPTEWPEPKRKELHDRVASLVSSSFGISDLSITFSRDVIEKTRGPLEALPCGAEPEFAGTPGGGI